MIIERKCSVCGASIKVDTDNFKIEIKSTGPLCNDCVEFIRKLSQKQGGA
jgi:hypothetical protein